MKTKEKRKMIFEDIYDLIKGTAINEPSNDWEKLAKKHEEQAKKELGKWVKNKNLEWDGDTNEIKIGSYFVIKLIERKKK